MAEKVANYGPEVMRHAEKTFLLQLLDIHWKEHLQGLDYLRQAVGLRAYAQRNPLNEYKMEAFELFQQMLAQLREHVTSLLSVLEIRFAENAAQGAGAAGNGEDPDGLPPDIPNIRRQPTEVHETRDDPALHGVVERELPATGTHGGGTVRHARADQMNPADPRTWGKVPRNALCPCGSGKKYKHCHGKVA